MICVWKLTKWNCKLTECNKFLFVWIWNIFYWAWLRVWSPSLDIHNWLVIEWQQQNGAHHIYGNRWIWTFWVIFCRILQLTTVDLSAIKCSAMLSTKIHSLRSLRLIGEFLCCLQNDEICTITIRFLAEPNMKHITDWIHHIINMRINILFEMTKNHINAGISFEKQIWQKGKRCSTKPNDVKSFHNHKFRFSYKGNRMVFTRPLKC